MKRFNGTVWSIKSFHSFGYLIFRIDKPSDIRRISRKGWEELEDI